MTAITDVWQDISAGFPVVDICSRDPPRLGGGKPFTPAYIRSRFSATKPAADDGGELLGLEGRKLRRILVPSGQRLWLKALDSQRDIVVETSGEVARMTRARKAR